MTTTGYEKRIAEANPGLKKGKVQRLAVRIAKRAEQMREQFDFYESCRILGILTDTTARDAVRNVEAQA